MSFLGCVTSFYFYVQLVFNSEFDDHKFRWDLFQSLFEVGPRVCGDKTLEQGLATDRDLRRDFLSIW